jgi:hypothetical protein
VYALPLKFQAGDNTFVVLGSGKVYDVATKTNIGVPIGAEADAYKAWVKSLKDAFVASKDQFFATMSDNTLVLNLDAKSKTESKPVLRLKTIGGQKCPSYTEETTKLFLVWLTGARDAPKSVKVKADRCNFIGAVVRRSVLEGKEGLKWWTPEQWEVLNERDNSQDLRIRLK